MPLPAKPKAKKAPKPRREKSKGRAVPLESAEQIAFFDWLRLAFPRLLAYHVPNGQGKLGKLGRIQSKRKGVTPGVPDINIDEPMGPYHGARIEMKRIKGGVISEDQEQIHAMLRAKGYYVIVAHGFEQARDALLKYLSFGEPVAWIR